jgi:hypothetical protein
MQLNITPEREQIIKVLLIFGSFQISLHRILKKKSIKTDFTYFQNSGENLSETLNFHKAQVLKHQAVTVCQN